MADLLAHSEKLGICLHELAAREAAVIKRVITFSGSQGRNYSLSPLPEAQMLIVSDNTPVNFEALETEGCMIIRIADADTTEPYDVLMTRPLLVTRVMRTLDEAKALLQSQPGGTAEIPVVEPVTEVATPAADTEHPVISTEPRADTTETSQSDNPSIIEEPTPAIPTTTDAKGVYHHKALVVDDSAAIRKQLEIELRQAGISAEFAENGEQALERVMANRYDLIFLDIIMPGMDGYETCRQLRNRAELKKTPIIMLSAKTSPLDEVQGVIAGASTYLTKPVKSDQLQKTLKRVSMWLDNFSSPV